MELGVYVDRIIQSSNTEALHHIFQDLCIELETPYFWGMIIPATSTRATPICVTNYPKEFVDEYLHDKRITRDPVISYSYQKSFPSTWHELFEGRSLKEEQLEQLSWASQFKINFGVSCPKYEMPTGFSLLHVVIDEKNQENSEHIEIIKKALNYLSSIIHGKMKMTLIANQNSHKCDRSTLSSRETECLLWAARGKSIWETAAILNLSGNTVRDYLNKAMIKLNASSKTEAVTKALIFGQINPGDIVLYFS